MRSARITVPERRNSTLPSATMSSSGRARRRSARTTTDRARAASPRGGGASAVLGMSANGASGGALAASAADIGTLAAGPVAAAAFAAAADAAGDAVAGDDAPVAGALAPRAGADVAAAAWERAGAWPATVAASRACIVTQRKARQQRVGTTVVVGAFEARWIRRTTAFARNSALAATKRVRTMCSIIPRRRRRSDPMPSTPSAHASAGVAWSDTERQRHFERWLAPLTQRFELDPASLAPASSDASFRRYLRIHSRARSFIVMDAPPPQEDVRPFVDIARRINAAGLHAPEILAADAAQGFLLLSDLGHTLYLDALRNAPAADADRLMREAIGALVQWQVRVEPHGLPPYDGALLRRELQLFPDWCVQREFGL